MVISLCVPTLNLFTTHIGKDSLMFFALCLFIWSIDDLNKNYNKIYNSYFGNINNVLYKIALAIPIFFVFLLFFPFIIENLSKIRKTNLFFIFLYSFIFIIFYFQIELMRTAGIISELGGMHINPNLNDLGYIFEKMKVYS